MLGFFKTWRKTPNSRLIRIRITFMKKSSIALAAAALAFAPALAQSANYFAPAYYASSDIYHGAGVALFKKGAEVDQYTGFRIPAITAGNGILIAASDVRYTGGHKDLAHGDGLYKTKLGVKVSYDGGLTWTPLNVIDATGRAGENNFMNMATDPAVLFDHNSDTIFMLGWQSNRHVGNGTVLNIGTQTQGAPNPIENIPTGEHSKLLLFTSKDHGKTWTTKDINDSILNQINQGQGTKRYDNVLQGPGGGMVYQGKIYMPIQAWATKAHTNHSDWVRTSGFIVSSDGGETWEASKMLIPNVDAIYMPIQAWATKAHTNHSDWVRTSGFIVSSDGGETWEASKMLIPNVDAKISNTDQMNNTSESNIFYHKGKIRLAVKRESGGQYAGNRLCFEYTQDANTGEWDWVKVEENFLPSNLTAIETSSHSVTEDVYFVSYSVGNRENPVLATNTGAKIQLATGAGLGYTSISSDDNNIYVLYEGVDPNRFSQMFKAIDWKHKDYAVLNTQMRNRAIELNEIQDKFSSGDSFMSVSYSSDLTEGSIVGGSNGLKGGIFIRGNKNVEEDMPTVAEYDVFDVTLLAGVEQT